VVVTAGSAVDIASIEPYADAIILAWYSGEQGGNALADIIFGDVAPSGRLPVTFYKSLADIPPYDHYTMKDRTYRYFDADVQFPFGFGLSYVSFVYAWRSQPASVYSVKDSISFSVSIRNTGSMDADEVAQVYIEYPKGDRMPLAELKQFRKVTVRQGRDTVVTFTVPVSELAKWDLQRNKWQLVKGKYTIHVGSSSRDFRLSKTVTIR
jgi:beta-glucosidase